MTQAANLAALGTNAGTTGILPAAGGGTAGTAGVTGFKNRIINGNMVISQRGTTFNDPGSNQYTLDRWHTFVSVSGKMNLAQSSTAPAGFINSLLITSASAYTIQSSDYFQVGQGIEGLNISDLAWGTADAKTVTISFWVRSSVTGTFACLVINHSATMNYPFNYTISSANTWTYITQTIPGPTSGEFLTNTSVGAELRFSVGVGSGTATGTAGVWSSNYWAPGSTASFVGTSGATWYVTGVQFEVGTAATNFDVRSYGTELELCQRYFEVFYADNQSTLFFSAPYSSQYRASIFYKVQKRATSTFALATGASWGGSTPDQIVNGLTVTNVYSGSAPYYLQGTANAPCASVSAEL